MDISDAQAHVIVVTYLLPALVIFTGVVAYVFGVRPILQQTPALKDIYAVEGKVSTALTAKFVGFKQRLTVIALAAMGFIVEAHDTIAPLVAQAGVDPTLILPKVPAWVWPLATMAILWLIQTFRNQADRAARANAEALLNAGHPLAAPAPGLPLNTLPSPNPLANLPDKPGA